MSRLEGELDSLRDRYLSTNEELAIINEDRVRLTEHVDQLKQQLQKSNDDKNVAQRASMKQVWLSFLKFDLLTGFDHMVMFPLLVKLPCFVCKTVEIWLSQ